jgi:hypothetical protein
MRWTVRAVVLSWVLVPFACKRVPEPSPSQTDAGSMEKLLAFANETGSDALSDLAASSNSAVSSASPSALASASALLAAFGSASALPSASISAAPSASLTQTASALASAAASSSAAPVVLSPMATKLLGAWVFSKFDLTDAGTEAKWKAVPADVQKEILKEAPKASIEFTPTHIVSRLPGVPDKKSTWSVESETDGEITIKTSDDGRKKLRFVGEELRIVDVDKKDAFVSLFARKPK